MMYGKKGILIAVCLLIFTVGCGTDDTVYLSQSATEQMEGFRKPETPGQPRISPGALGQRQESARMRGVTEQQKSAGTQRVPE